MKFDRQLQPVTETSWVVSYGGKTIPRWRTAVILKIDISPYPSEKSFDFDEILYNKSVDERHVIINKKVALDRLRVRQNVFLVYHNFVTQVPTDCLSILLHWYVKMNSKWSQQYHKFMSQMHLQSQTCTTKACTDRAHQPRDGLVDEVGTRHTVNTWNENWSH